MEKQGQPTSKMKQFEVSDEFDRLTPREKSRYFHETTPGSISSSVRRPWKTIIAVFLMPILCNVIME